MSDNDADRLAYKQAFGGLRAEHNGSSARFIFDPKRRDEFMAKVTAHWAAAGIPQKTFPIRINNVTLESPGSELIIANHSLRAREWWVILGSDGCMTDEQPPIINYRAQDWELDWGAEMCREAADAK